MQISIQVDKIKKQEDATEISKFFHQSKVTIVIPKAQKQIVLQGDKDMIMDSIRRCPLVYNNRKYELVLTGKSTFSFLEVESSSDIDDMVSLLEKQTL